MQNGVYVEENISIWGYLHNQRVFCYKVFSVFIIYQGLSFGGFALKIELVVFVYELVIYLWNYFLLLGYAIITSTSDLQPSTAIANQLPGQLVSIQIRTSGPAQILYE